MAFDSKQRGVLLNMLAALALTLLVLIGAIAWQPEFLLPEGVLPNHLAFALRWDAAVLVCLVIAIGNLARHRFFTPADIDGSGLTSGTDRARMFQAILQNTLEQSVLAVLAHLVWAASVPGAWLGAIPAAVILFVVGRIAFAAGYSGGAPARAFGFALTFYPTMFLTVVAIAMLVKELWLQ